MNLKKLNKEAICLFFAGFFLHSKYYIMSYNNTTMLQTIRSSNTNMILMLA